MTTGDTATSERDTDELRPGGAPERSRGELAGFFRLLAISLIVAAVIRALLVQVYFIPSGSMMPTLTKGDRIAVEKVTLRFDELRRGDVIVFDDPDPDEPYEERSAPVALFWEAASFVGVPDPSQTALVKRVVGLPGETVRIDDQGVVSIDGVAISEPYVSNVHRREFGPVTVPPGELLMLGDNRPASDDSRFSLGFVEDDLVIGRVAGILWPLDRAGGLEDGTQAD